MENGWELTSELTSKWITFTSRWCLQNYMENLYSIKFHTNLINNFWSTEGSCRNTSRWRLQIYMENGWELKSEFTSKWITFKNIQSNFTLISLLTFEVLNQTSPNLQGSCRNTSRWRLQNAMENGWELTSELTSKWITFTNIQSNFTLISLINFWSTKSNFAKFTGKLP